MVFVQAVCRVIQTLVQQWTTLALQLDGEGAERADLAEPTMGNVAFLSQQGATKAW